MPGKEKRLKDEIIRTGLKLYQSGLSRALSGNLSARLNKHEILITATGTCLGRLRYAGIVKVNLDTGKPCADKCPSSELKLHSLIYKNFPAQAILHCHPPLINGYFSVNSTLKVLTLETRLYLKEVPVVRQTTPTVTKPEPVIEALKKSRLVVLKNHGVVAAADTFAEALIFIEALEQAVKVAAIARLFAKKHPDRLDKILAGRLTQG